jgi:hypothetical protein
MVDPITVTIVIGILGAIGAATALIFWHKILRWAEDSVYPWLKKNIPSMESSVRLAFSVVDNVAAPVRSAVKQAWSNLRRYLLKQTIELQKKSSSEWTLRTTSWMIKVLESGEQAPVKRETEENKSWDELPEDAREQYLRNKKEAFEFNVTETRDKELMEMTA